MYGRFYMSGDLLEIVGLSAKTLATEMGVIPDGTTYLNYRLSQSNGGRYIGRVANRLAAVGQAILQPLVLGG